MNELLRSPEGIDIGSQVQWTQSNILSSTPRANIIEYSEKQGAYDPEDAPLQAATSHPGLRARVSDSPSDSTSSARRP